MWPYNPEPIDSKDRDPDEISTAEEFSNLAQRIENIDALHSKMAEWTAGFDDRELSETLQGNGVAAAPVLNVGDLLEDPHYKARETFVEVTHSLGFQETIYGAYVKTSKTEADIKMYSDLVAEITKNSPSAKSPTKQPEMAWLIG